MSVRIKPVPAFIQGEGVEAVKCSPHGNLGGHHVNVSTTESPPQRAPWLLLEAVHHYSCDVCNPSVLS
jgi:hypothetical protein